MKKIQSRNAQSTTIASSSKIDVSLKTFDNCPVDTILSLEDNDTHSPIAAPIAGRVPLSLSEQSALLTGKFSSKMASDKGAIYRKSFIPFEHDVLSTGVNVGSREYAHKCLPSIPATDLGALQLHSTVASPADSLPRKKGQEFRITSEEKKFLATGNLRQFWLSRLGNDPMARMGVGIWGADTDLFDAIKSSSQSELSYWRPTLNPFLKEILAMKFEALVIPPVTRNEIFEYWHAMGKEAEERVMSAIQDKISDPSLSTKKHLQKTYHSLGLRIAIGHATAVEEDLDNMIGDIPGVLSREQIMRYHHKALTEFGLSATAYGGTPYKVLPDLFELYLAGAAYVHDSDD